MGRVMKQARRMRVPVVAAIALGLAGMMTPAQADPGGAAGTANTSARGPVTSLPLPRFVSMKAARANVRRGPSLTHRIDWVFRHRNTPLEITAEYGHWRRVRDHDGAGGWMHYSLLSGVRTVIVEADMLTLRARAGTDAMAVARLEAGVIARVLECGPEWCRLDSDGYVGWAPKQGYWGVRTDETLD